jgi:hypothetical protein
MINALHHLGQKTVRDRKRNYVPENLRPAPIAAMAGEICARIEFDRGFLPPAQKPA